ncbi:ribonucleoside-diphosphate reductase beta chain [Melghirimyces profundicolus]|uniref:R2-like ligand binding oxidase n=1 Tax=Melghirimyces profundicolus TaxID=1242148 RepID=A0A2T6BXI9_9BACL|nr:R2-like ligand-binding oxidase [Melghirimyces profundicolus]PTX60773.1 ribonucleoside-diphosphate reductase beta chain [Melghirimyces profundicolus]
MRELQTTGEQGLNHDLLPMRLYHKAKKLGVWDPKEIDFSRDIKDWKAMDESEKETILRLCSMFQAGEEAVTRDLLPLIRAISLEGRVEEEMYLTTFLFEEAKHTELFRRFLDEVIGAEGDLTPNFQDNYRAIFYEYLPRAMERLIGDPSPEAMVEASVTYNMIVEGVLAETGYQAFYQALKEQGKMPGIVQGIGYLQRDESRHIAYGTYLLQRLVAADPDLWEVLSKRMELLLPYAIGVVNELWDRIEGNPFGMEKETFLDFAMKQFSARMDRLENTQRNLDEVWSSPLEEGV